MYAVFNEIVHILTGSYLGGDSGMRQGASTLNQQLVKNLTYDDDVLGISGYFRKIREIYRAVILDINYTKQEILEAYLNVIGLTGNTAGVQAESIKLFNKPVSELTLEQCASIAAITKNPYGYNPVTHEEEHLARRNYILYEMWQQGYVSQEEYLTASAQPIGLSHGVVNVPKTQTTSYFTDTVITQVSYDLVQEYNLTQEEAINLLYNGGLRIYTTADIELQTETEKVMLNESGVFSQREVAANIKQYDEFGNVLTDENNNEITIAGTEKPQAAMVSVSYSGELKAVVGGLYEKTISRGLNRATGSLRQVGSTMKPISPYVLAIENNKMHWSTLLNDAPVGTITDELTQETRDWPRNYSDEYTYEEYTLADALAQSINTIAVQVGQDVGINNMYNFTKNKLNITSLTKSDKDIAPLTLGALTQGISPYELAGAYMMFGNGGNYTTLHCYKDVQTSSGKNILAPDIKTTGIISEETSYIMQQMLKGVMQNGGTAAGYTLNGGVDSFGKTGTSSANKDFWFVGLTPEYVTATWYGYDSGASIQDQNGITAPISAWQQVMNNVYANEQSGAFINSNNVITAEYCTQTGYIATQNCPHAATGYYKSNKIPNNCLIH